MNFFLKRLPALSSESGNPIDSFHPLVVAPKNKCKVKKWSKSVNNDTKDGLLGV